MGEADLFSDRVVYNEELNVIIVGTVERTVTG